MFRYHPKVILWEIETLWKHLNCFIRGNANLKLHLRACWRGQDQRESEVQGNSSMLSRLLQKSFWWKSSNCKNPKKVVQMKLRKCECTPHIWEQRRWMTTSKEWWCDIFLAKQWFWRGFQDFRKWQFEQFHFLILSNLRPYLLSSVVFRLKFLDAQTLRKSRRTTWKIQDLKTKTQINCFPPISRPWFESLSRRLLTNCSNLF